MRFDLLLLARVGLGKSLRGDSEASADGCEDDCLGAHATRLPKGSGLAQPLPYGHGSVSDERDRERGIEWCQKDSRPPSWSVRPESAAPVICPTVEPPMLMFGMPRLVWLRALVASNR